MIDVAGNGLHREDEMMSDRPAAGLPAPILARPVPARTLLAEAVLLTPESVLLAKASRPNGPRRAPRSVG